MSISVNKISKFDNFPRPIGKNSRVYVTKELQKNLFPIFNENNMTALQNYAEKKKATMFFEYMPDDLFHNTAMIVLKDNSIETTKKALKISFKTKEDFVNSLREIYNFASESVQKLYKND